jgi:GWxTD domain-containing protein
MTPSSVKNIFLLEFALVMLWAGAPVYAQSAGDLRLGTEKASYAVPSRYQRWLDEDVRWIITTEEKAAFAPLSSNQERDRFIEQFWLRRDPTPATSENEFKEEHYRRLAYSNVHFAHAIPGWQTDRGRTYILYGTPQRITVEHPQDDFNSIRPSEVWHYNSLRGSAVDFKFIDVCSCGDYRLQSSPPN